MRLLSTWLPLLLAGTLTSQEPAEAPPAPDTVVRYESFGAQGDGEADDLEAIVRAHAHANRHGLPVRAKDGATYRIGRSGRTAIIETDTDFGSARFLIDDTDVENLRAQVFLVRSKQKSFELDGVESLRKGQEQLDVSLPGDCLVTVTDSSVRRYIRYGANQNRGKAQTDVFLLGRDGRVDGNGPIVWDFDQISRITARPVDTQTLTVRGGRFTTIANAAESKSTYYARGLAIERSNVVVDGLEHRITGEGEHGAPYGGFLRISSCAHVTVRNTVLTGHKTYRTIGSAGREVSMGSYDILVDRALYVSFVNCSQTNDIKDRRYWGIMGSNYCKNLLYDRCTLSRFDAHQGVVNATIRDSTLGYMGINAIGFGTFTVEGSTVYGYSFINLRPDYGSTWRGEVIIRDCTFVPASGRRVAASLIGGSHTGQHDFGYTCYIPERIVIDGLHIDDANHPEDYRGPTVFADFNRRMTDASYTEEFPQVRDSVVVLEDVTTASGKPLRISDKPSLFRGVKMQGSRVK